VITSLIQLKLFYRNILRIVKAYYENILGIDISISDGYKCITGVISNLRHFFTNEATATEKEAHMLMHCRSKRFLVDLIKNIIYKLTPQRCVRF